jgi:colanic acid biosynthesis glycosyl transferase WcaI
MARIAIIVHLFHPDELAGAALFSDLAQFLKANGHDVRITTPFPYYPAWKVRKEDQGIAFRDETFDGMPVRRVRMYVPARPTGATRVICDLSLFWGLLRRAEWKDWTPDVVVTSSPMFSTCLAQRFIYRRRRIPRVIIVHDFVVDAALELKMLALPGIRTLLFGLERWSFLSASTLLTICEPMLEKLRKKVRNQRRCVLLPNWIHSSLEKEIERQTAAPVAREPAQLFYAGNVGVKQGLHIFINSFREIGGDWRLRVHGGGAEAEKLRKMIGGMDRITLAPVLDEPQYVRSLRGATACLVTQKPGTGPDFLPSKLLPALATGSPVLAVCERDSPLGREVKEGGFGVVLDPGDTDGLRRTLERWSADPAELAVMSSRSLERARLYSRAAILDRYQEEILRVVNSSRQ